MSSAGATYDENAPTRITIGEQYFVESTIGEQYCIKVLKVHKVTSSVFVHYDGYSAKYDAWLPIDRVKVPTRKADRKSIGKP